ncbi:FecCD family ABC transporter permease [Rhodococcoides fascians]|uniref:FecCD family ABC transporter permease n=1 Tax=Rhodococcoides fascians TaxID=1828 RepID=UPI0005634E13|nr:iron chelate uptake ABC transporter family permease subunit [Rhodococcus fascians]
MTIDVPPKPPVKVDFGYPVVNVGTRLLTGRFQLRAVVVNSILTAIALVLAVRTLGLGKYPIGFSESMNILFGGGGEDFRRMIVMEWRLPVIVAALVLGALLGIGGAIFQSLTRNPLGSPDIIGFDSGSYFAVVLVMLVFSTRTYSSIAAASLIGGLLTAMVVFFLAYRGGVQGFRLIIVGIAVSAVLGSVNSYLITRAAVSDAMAVGFWGAGSITRVRWNYLTPTLVIFVVLLICVAAMARSLRLMELGDDSAKALGVNVNRSRLVLVVLGVSTTAIVTAVAGPIGFVALAAPQLAQRLVRSPGVSVWSGAFMGAALLMVAHFLSLTIEQYYRAVPVGLVTVCIGGLYFIYLLVKGAKERA